jgi:hypothetical protein
MCLGLIFILAAGCLTASPEETPSKELIQYVRDAKKAGLKDDQIEKNAARVGWSAPAVKDAIQYVQNPASAAPEPTAAKSAPARPRSVVNRQLLINDELQAPIY